MEQLLLGLYEALPISPTNNLKLIIQNGKEHQLNVLKWHSLNIERKFTVH